MNRKKLNVFTALILLVFYCISSAFIYTFSYTKVTDNYQSEYYTVCAQYFNEEREYYSLEDFLIDITNATKEYPSVITVFDDNYTIAAQSGSMVEIAEDGGAVSKYCYLDKYITDDIAKKLLKAEYQYDVLADISYTEQDGEIILGEILFNTYTNRKEQSVKFNDLAESKKSLGCYYAFVDVDKNSFRHENYEYLRNNMEEMEEKYGMRSSNYNGPSEILHFSKIAVINEFENKSYSVCWQSQITPSLETISSDAFKTAMLELLFVFITVGAVILIVINKYYLKKQRLESAKYAFTNAAAHELKTPLAVIENQCECILENVNEEKNSEYVKSIYEESIRMTQLVNNMLKFNKLSTTDQIEKENTSLTDIVKSEIEKYSSFINTGGHKVIADIDDVSMNCSSDLIQLAVDNYISNAVKHAPLNTEIEIKLKKEGNTCRFSVLNVVDKPLTDEVWDSFYMGDKSREGKSAGMGLAITKQILELHHYKYGFENKANAVEFYFIAK